MIQEPNGLMDAEPFENIVELYKNPLQAVCKQLKIDWIEGISCGN